MIMLALLLTMAAANEPSPARPAVPFQKHAEVDCDWMMKSPAEELIRGSIGQGDDDPILYLVDPVFDGWSDTEDHSVELSAGGSGGRAKARAYATHGGGSPGSLGIYLNAEARQIVGGATAVQVWKDGKPVLNLAFANTPSAAELDACVRPPGWDEHSDSE
ncbi:MAG TPA: hypothetical protein VFU80_01290 [Sphingomicrobium sp.]|nr:hypothetical protein [Sphingomicrobium sp.]